VLASANANTPKGYFSRGPRMWEVGANDQLFNAVDYEPLLVAYHNGTAVRISDVGRAEDSVEDIRNSGYANGKPSVLVIIFRQPGANIIDTVDRVRAILPQLKASIPQAIDVKVAMDQTVTIRASVNDVERTLMISVLLVVLVVFFFLRNPRATFIPSVAVPVSLIGTFGVMYLLNYSVDNLSLMALTIATGSSVADGRHCGPAIPGVRDDPLDRYRCFHGHFPHRDSHDVRPSVETARVAWLDVPVQRTSLHMGGECIREDAGRGAKSCGDYFGNFAGHHWTERLLVYSRA